MLNKCDDKKAKLLEENIQAANRNLFEAQKENKYLFDSIRGEIEELKGEKLNSFFDKVNNQG